MTDVPARPGGEPWAYRSDQARVEPEEFDGIRSRLDEITGWPWYRSDGSVVSWTARPSHLGPTMVTGQGVTDDGSPVHVFPDDIDGQFIADAPSIIAGLLEAAEHWRARFQHARDELRALGGAS